MICTILQKDIKSGRGQYPQIAKKMMEQTINFSRHAKRRMQLYDLSEEDVRSVIACQDPELHFGEGKHQIVSEAKFSRQGYPIKVVFSCENGIIVVITAYPLKRGFK